VGPRRRRSRTYGFGALALALLLFSPGLAAGRPDGSVRVPRTYYLSPAGADTNPGTSPARPWKTLARASRVRYGAGDRILLSGGHTFAGALGFTPHNARGTARAPITVSSYGKGRATIAGSLLARNVAAISVTRLRFLGRNPANGGSAVAFLNSGKQTLTGIRISDVEVSGFTNPILVYAIKPPAAFRRITIERVSVHDNAQGPVLFGWLGRASTLDNDRFGLADVAVRRLHSFRNTGAGLKGGYGAGLVVLNAERVTIERNVIHDNGGDNPERTPNGPSGITVYDARDLLIQENEVFRQRYDRRNQTDNSGIDVWARRALIQYNYVHDNEGWGFVFGSSDPAVTGPGVSWLSSDVTLRYNVAENNGRPLARSESMVGQVLATVLMFGQIERFHIYNNTFFRAPGRRPAAHPDLVQGMLYLVDVPGVGRPWSQVHVRNNLFVVRGNTPAVEIARPAAGTDVRFEGNAYVGIGAQPQVRWADQSYDVAGWSAATGQETLGGRPVAAVAGAKALCAPGTGRTVFPRGLRALRAYRLRADSPLIDRGLDLRATAGVDVGRRDYFGNRIPAGNGFDVGAHEFRAGQACTSAP
jgi:hypothetical protein